METPFYSQNTGRFYPFDDASTASIREEYGECILDVLRRGIVDLGLVVISNDSYTAPVISSCKISKSGKTVSVSVTVTCTGESHNLTFSCNGLQDFITVKSSTSRVYGFLTFGLSSVWDVHDFSISQIPVYRGCVKWLNHVQLGSVSIVNEDRWLPNDECAPDRFAGRPSQWSYGYVTDSNLILRAGYNCRISFLERENKIQIQPILRSGMGEVKEQVGLGYNLLGSAVTPSFEPYFSNVLKRFDSIRSDVVFAKSVANAYGINVALTLDNNFKSQIIKIGSDEVGSDEKNPAENGNCVKQCLLIKCIRKFAGDCEPVYAPSIPDCEPISSK